MEAAGFHPDEDQLRAILHEGGPLSLPAGPGSGKTRVLLWRTFNLIVFRGVDPGRIFLSTFTEKAARQLESGLLSLLAVAGEELGRPFDTAELYVDTLHSLSGRILGDRRFCVAYSRAEELLVLPRNFAYTGDYTSFMTNARGATWPSAPTASPARGLSPGLRRPRPQEDRGAPLRAARAE